MATGPRRLVRSDVPLVAKFPRRSVYIQRVTIVTVKISIFSRRNAFEERCSDLQGQLIDSRNMVAELEAVREALKDEVTHMV